MKMRPVHFMLMLTCLLPISALPVEHDPPIAWASLAMTIVALGVSRPATSL